MGVVVMEEVGVVTREEGQCSALQSGDSHHYGVMSAAAMTALIVGIVTGKWGVILEISQLQLQNYSKMCGIWG